MYATATTLDRWTPSDGTGTRRRVRRSGTTGFVQLLRAFGVRRAVGCLAAAIAGGGVVWNWASLLSPIVHVSWLAPVAALLASVAIALAIATVDADERSA